MAKISYIGLKEQAGLLDAQPCTKEENERYSEMIQKGQALPSDILVCKNKMGEYYFYNTSSNVPSEEKEELFVLMRIYNDIHFIRNVVMVGLISAAVLFCVFNLR